MVPLVVLIFLSSGTARGFRAHPWGIFNFYIVHFSFVNLKNNFINLKKDHRGNALYVALIIMGAETKKLAQMSYVTKKP
jgi:hypothetical protein